MAKRKCGAPRYPRDLMQDVCWSFTGPTFTDQAKFVEAVRQYGREIRGECIWDPDEVVLPSSRVRIEHDYAEEPDESSVELTTDNPTGFTAGELLFKVHNAFVDQLSEGDHVFFEGFTLMKKPRGDTPPLYEIDLGS